MSVASWSGRVPSTRVVTVGRLRAQPLGAEPLQLVQADHPAAVGSAVERHDLHQVGQLGPVGPQLLDLGVVLDQGDPGARVVEDVGHVLGVGGGVDGGRRRPCAEDGEVGERPLDPGRGDDRDAFLGLDPQCDQSGRHGLDPLHRSLPSSSTPTSRPTGSGRPRSRGSPPPGRGTSVPRTGAGSPPSPGLPSSADTVTPPSPDPESSCAPRSGRPARLNPRDPPGGQRARRRGRLRTLPASSGLSPGIPSIRRQPVRRRAAVTKHVPDRHACRVGPAPPRCHPRRRTRGDDPQVRPGSAVRREPLDPAAARPSTLKRRTGMRGSTPRAPGRRHPPASARRSRPP